MNIVRDEPVRLGQGAKPNQEAVDVLVKYLALARAGKINRLGIVTLMDEQWSSEFTSSDNQLVDGAMLIELGLRRMGFQIVR